MNILVVDDNDKTLVLLRAVLSKHGHSVVTSDNALKALSIISQTPIDLILSDMAMPDMNGAEFCEAVRKEEDDTHRRVTGSQQPVTRSGMEPRTRCLMI